MQKLYFSISELSGLVQEEQHILRYWEKEFEQLKPKKNRGGNRIYSQKDLLIIRTIKKLIRDDKLSLRGAKENLQRILAASEAETVEAVSSNASVQIELGEKNTSKNESGEQSELISLNKSDILELIREFRELELSIRSF